jgi:membrane protease YdiL (CAAX protease family)
MAAEERDVGHLADDARLSWLLTYSQAGGSVRLHLLSSVRALLKGVFRGEGVNHMLKLTRTSWSGRIILFLVVAYGIAWTLEGLGLAMSNGHSTGELTAFGVFGPAVAGLILSRNGQRPHNVRQRLWLGVAIIAWLACWAVGYYSLAAPIRVRYGLAAVALSAMIAVLPAWILSAALSLDQGVRAFISTLVAPRSWLWTSLAVALFATFLLIPVLLPAPLRGEIRFPRIPAAPPLAVQFIGLTFLQTFIYGGGVGEEPGWRGYLLPALQERCSPLLASIVVWFFWALWHLPLDLNGYVGNTFAAYLDNRFFRLLRLTVIATWLYNRSRGSILPTALFHTSFNTFPLWMPSATGVVWLLWVWAAAVVALDRMWRRCGELKSASMRRMAA